MREIGESSEQYKSRAAGITFLEPFDIIGDSGKQSHNQCSFLERFYPGSGRLGGGIWVAYWSKTNGPQPENEASVEIHRQ